MIDEGGTYLLARLLFAIFGKKRPSFAYAVFVSLILLVCAVFIVQAKSVDDAMFPVIALTFTLAYILIDAFSMVRRISISDFHLIEDDLQFEDEPGAKIEDVPETKLPKMHVPPKTPSPHGSYMSVGIMTGGLMLPVMFAGGFAILMLIEIESRDIFAAELGLMYTFCVLWPFAGLIAAGTSRVVKHFARQFSPHANLTSAESVSVTVVGVLAGVIATAIYFYLLCIDGWECGL